MHSKNLAPDDILVCGLSTNNFDPQDPNNPDNCNPLYCTIEGKSPYPNLATPDCCIPDTYVNNNAIPNYAIPNYSIPNKLYVVNNNPYFNINDSGYTPIYTPVGPTVNKGFKPFDFRTKNHSIYAVLLPY